MQWTTYMMIFSEWLAEWRVLSLAKRGKLMGAKQMGDAILMLYQCLTGSVSHEKLLACVNR